MANLTTHLNYTLQAVFVFKSEVPIKHSHKSLVISYKTTCADEIFFVYGIDL